ncbi:30S ribosomal protein S17 [Candidatus Curtissbacteria bacterium]|nr:30S ribosomal protein S17 [Candidatus Curtissbacteria bacterium]
MQNKQSFSTNKQSFSANKQSFSTNKVGTVDSVKMQKTVVVKVVQKVKHPFYKKLMTKTARFKAHDDLGTELGQRVKIVETKPISKDVHFKVTEVIK